MAMETPTCLIEAMLTDILARLPLRSIARFKTVCKTWKTTIESPYFRRVFVSAHRNSSSSWSLLLCGTKEIIGFHGCETWDLPKSPAYFIPPSLKHSSFGYFSYAASSSGLVLINDSSYSDESYCYVGNPVLKQWIRIPPAPSSSIVLGLVTRVDEDGVVSSFKVIRNMYYISLNGTAYFGWVSVYGVLVAHDFYSESNEFRVVKLPDYQSDKKGLRRFLTMSGGFIMYVTAFYQTEDDVMKIWRLNDDDESWKLLWVIKLPSISVYVPMAMHPFDIGTVYLCSHHDRHLVSCNLRTLNYTILKDGYQDCFIDQSVCDSFVNGVSDPRSSSYLWNGVSVKFLPLVLPRWMGSVPCPPQAEMIDTVSLLSYMTSTDRTMKRKNRNDNDF
ncbi:F-box protein At3g26010-like [Brassica rapa]|uniref:F-box protein At3g26010-like n=1 Tax=Brassica campestris TaxID=3711 RepID=UPI00142E6679|nr:F-box protein At3g26010-like [Brassica rapa]